jgi:hypothetical protein
MKYASSLLTLSFCLLVTVSSGCGQTEAVKEITETRSLDKPLNVPANITSAQRFGMRMASNPSPSQHSLPFTYEVPEGWTEAPANSLRLINLVPAGDPRAECYVTILPGDGGGVNANINRWREQMSLEPYTEEEFAALPKRTLLGVEAVYVEFEGLYTGMSGDQSEPNYKLAGLILPLNNSGMFIKMLGPKDVIDKEMARFEAFCSSFAIRQEAATAQPAAAAGSGGHVHQDGLELAWSAPEGWNKAADRPMRAVTFALGENSSTECYVSVFPGDAGGLVSNINRWARQIGAEPLNEPAVAELPVVTIMGAAAPMVEFSGSFSDNMSGLEVADATLLGAIAEHAGHSIFVKLVGPAEEVAKQKVRFVAFCESIGH